MKKICSVVLMAFSLAVAAEEYVSPVTGQAFDPAGKFTLEQIKARDERVLKKTGGFLTQKAQGPLTLFVDAREKGTLTLDQVQRLFKKGANLDSILDKCPRGDVAPLVFAQKKMAEHKALMTLMIVEKCPDLPALSVYPEERIGLVNADKLRVGNDSTVFELRVAKEVWRALGFVGGIGFSAQENDMMQPYYTLKELDGNIHAYIQPMNMAKLGKFLKRFNVKKEARVPYSFAVQQGWAPAPTNDYQKAIWEKVHQLPSEPIKIKPEAQKVKD